jgi:hypothetical protein
MREATDVDESGRADRERTNGLRLSRDSANPKQTATVLGGRCVDRDDARTIGSLVDNRPGHVADGEHAERHGIADGLDIRQRCGISRRETTPTCREQSEHGRCDDGAHFEHLDAYTDRWMDEGRVGDCRGDGERTLDEIGRILSSG